MLCRQKLTIRAISHMMLVTSGQPNAASISNFLTGGALGGDDRCRRRLDDAIGNGRVGETIAKRIQPLLWRWAARAAVRPGGLRGKAEVDHVLDRLVILLMVIGRSYCRSAISRFQRSEEPRFRSSAEAEHTKSRNRPETLGIADFVRLCGVCLQALP